MKKISVTVRIGQGPFEAGINKTTKARAIIVSRIDDDGTEVWNKPNECVMIEATGEIAKQVARFKPGDFVSVEGRFNRTAVNTVVKTEIFVSSISGFTPHSMKIKPNLSGLERPAPSGYTVADF